MSERIATRIVLCEFCAAQLAEHYAMKKIATESSGAIGKNCRCGYCKRRVHVGGLFEITPKRRVPQ